VFSANSVAARAGRAQPSRMSSPGIPPPSRPRRPRHLHAPWSRPNQAAICSRPGRFPSPDRSPHGIQPQSHPRHRALHCPPCAGSRRPGPSTPPSAPSRAAKRASRQVLLTAWPSHHRGATVRITLAGGPCPMARKPLRQCRSALMTVRRRHILRTVAHRAGPDEALLSQVPPARRATPVLPERPSTPVVEAEAAAAQRDARSSPPSDAEGRPRQAPGEPRWRGLPSSPLSRGSRSRITHRRPAR
jgi:hypothetical protein